MRCFVFLFFCFFCFSVSASFFSSEDIVFSVNQSDYYFAVGESAVVPLGVSNSYGEDVVGVLTYSYAQGSSSGGSHFSSSNSRSTSLTVKDGEDVLGLGFGTASSPVVFVVDLSFVYFSDGEERVVDLDDVFVHFVSGEDEKQSSDSGQSASSEKRDSGSGSSQQESLASQMQQQLNEMMNSGSGSSQSSQDALQNSQMNQDSSAAREQMRKEIAEGQAMEEEFKKQIAGDESFQDANSELGDLGYSLSGADFSVDSEDSGDFNLTYENEAGETASLRGSMENGSMESLSKSTAEDRRVVMDSLVSDERFLKYNESLSRQGYSMKDLEIEQDGNLSDVRVSYENGNNETANITAVIEDGVVRDVELEKSGSWNVFWWVLFVLACVVGCFVYVKFFRRVVVEGDVVVVKKSKKVFNYKRESVKMLKSSKRFFDEGNFKDAYGMANGALRLFLSYKNGLKKEVTNDEIVSFLRSGGKDFGAVKGCFDLCSLVEFAKYKANRKDFDRIVDVAEGIIRGG